MLALPHRWRAIIFDLGETLVHQRQPWETAMAEGARLVARALASQSLVSRPDQFAAHLLNECELARRRSKATLREQPYRSSLRNSLAAFIDNDVPDEMVTQLLRLYCRPEETRWNLFPEVPAALQELRAAGFSLAVLSNGPDHHVVENILELHQLASFFDCVCSSAQGGWRKPAPQAFDDVLRRLAVTSDRAIFVGDDVEYDILGAQRAGMTAFRREVTVRRAGDVIPDVEPADAVIHSLSELLSLVVASGSRPCRSSLKG